MIPRWEIAPTDERRQVDGKLLTRARIPRRYWTATVEKMADGKNAEAKAKFVEYLENLNVALKRGTGLLLHGEFGCGKTAAACLTLTDVLARSSNRVFFTPAAEIDWMARHREESDQNGVLHWDVLTQAPFACLDDLGAERDAAWNKVFIEDVVRQRYNDLLPTIITTNRPLADLYKNQPWLESIVADSFSVIEMKGKFR